MPLAYALKISHIHKIKKIKFKRHIHYGEVPQSPFPIRKTSVRARPASLTVEAALALPLGLWAIVALLFFFCVLQASMDTQGALLAAGNQLALELTGQEEANSRAILYFWQQMKEKGDSKEWITGGYGGISWLGTDTRGQDVVLCIQYRCKVPVPVFHLGSIPISQQVRLHKWIGEDGKEGEEQQQEEWVYVAANGQVYHKSRSCTYLQLSIEAVSPQTALANYKPCQVCGGGQEGLCYYVTKEGTRYHTRLSCSGLKRTIRMVRLSQIPGYPACSRCGG